MTNITLLLAKRADHKTAHLLHLILALITLGLWVPVWILVAVSHRIERRRIDRLISQSQTREAA